MLLQPTIPDPACARHLQNSTTGFAKLTADYSGVAVERDNRLSIREESHRHPGRLAAEE